MLTGRERQLLDEIERCLTESDPDLAQRLTGVPRVAQVPRWRGWAALVAGWLLALTAVVVGSWIAAVIVVGPLIAVTVAWILNATRFRNPRS